MKKNENNFAFIDSQNLNLSIQKLGWKLDYRKFRVYLAEKYSVQKAYMFIGFVALNQSLYDNLQEAGFILKFKPTIPDADGKIKGNVDADLVLQAVIEMGEYDKAVSLFQKAADAYPDFRNADYASLMAARNLEKLARNRGLSQEEADGLAKPAYEQVIHRFRGSPYAKVATHELQQMERRARPKGE